VADLKNKFLYQFLLAFTQLAFPLVTYPYLARTLAPAGIGKVSYVEFVAGLVITIFSIGIPLYGVREIAKTRNEPAKRAALINDLLWIHLLLSLAGIVIFCGIIFLNPNYHKEYGLIILGASYILLQVFAIEWYLQGMEAFRFMAWRSIGIRLLGIIAIFLFIKNDSDYLLYYLIIVATQLLVTIAATSKLLVENKLSITLGRLGPHTKPLFFFFLTSSFVSIYVFFDTIILGYLAAKEHVGYYTFGLRIIKLPLGLLLTLNTILYPRIAFLHKAGEHQRIDDLVRFSLLFIVSMTIPVCTCFYLLAPEIVQLLGGSKFSATVPVLKILSPLPFIISLSSLFVLQVLAPLHKERLIMFAVLAACILSLALNFALIPSMAERGASVAAVITESTVLLLAFLFSYKKINRQFPFMTGLATLFTSALAWPVVWLCRQYTGNALVILLTSLGLFGLLYYLLQYFIFKNEALRVMTTSFARSFTMKKSSDHAG
jgi:O-antigen/teichoic acid export membrane protein